MIGRTPWSYEPRAPKAPLERSSEPYPQPGCFLPDGGVSLGIIRRARWTPETHAGVGNGAGDALAVLGVGDVDLLAAVGATVDLGDVHRHDVGRVTVDVAARAGDTVLRVEGGLARVRARAGRRVRSLGGGGGLGGRRGPRLGGGRGRRGNPLGRRGGRRNPLGGGGRGCRNASKSVKLREVTSRNRYAPSQVEVDEGFSQVEVVVGFSQVEVDEGFSALEDDGAVQDDDDDGAVHSLEDDDEEDGADQAEVDDDGESEPERAALAAVVSVSLAKRQSTYSVGGRSHQSRGEKERCEREQDALRSVLEPSRAA